MPAVENNNTVDQCDKLNKTSFPKLWFDTGSPDATAIPLIVAGGVLNTFSSAISQLSPTELDANILLNPSMTSTFSLEQFLAGVGVTSASGDFKKLGNVLLSVGVSQGSSGRTYQSIVDNYFVPKLGSTPYTFSTTSSPKLTASMLWAPSDKMALNNNNNGATSILGTLIANKLLLSEREIYNPSDFDPNLAVPPANTESLLYLQSIASNIPGASSTTAGGTTITTLTENQKTRRTTLESRNLRFFGAWLAEYCYYRSRYNWLLKKYFDIYTQTYSPPNMTTNNTLAKLFAGEGSGPNQYSAATKNALPQSEYLRCLVYHMACLNTRMVDMRLLLGKISEYYSEVQTTIQNAVNSEITLGSNKDLTEKITILNDSAANVQKYITERDFRQGVMDYNLEKNRYANILLGLYAFLNILAVAVIIQIKQS